MATPPQPARKGGSVFVELVRLVVVVSMTALGYSIARTMTPDPTSPKLILGAVLGSSVGYVAGGMLGRLTARLLGLAENRLAAIPGADFVAGGLGIVGGVVIGSVVSLPLLLLPERSFALPMIAFLQVVMGYLGFRVGLSKREDMLQLFGLTYRTRAPDLRVLDTSALLNPQLLDFVRAGLLRGTLLVPIFVLEEAQGIADSEDRTRRQRARTGLDALEAIRGEGLVEVRIVEKTYPEFGEVDAKVTALARERGATLVTDDTNLARVAELQDIHVMSLRRIAQALRPAVMPGEQIRIDLLRPGKNPGQAVGFLEDGSMVVVADALEQVGSTVDAIADRIVPTSGGRMIFAHLAGAESS